MTISWFPGHMHKARKALRTLARETDLWVELLDARAPAASANPELRRLFLDIPVIHVLTKSDLADAASSERWREYLRATGSAAVLLSSKAEPVATRQLLECAAAMVPARAAHRNRGKQLVLAGIPNVGKSTLLNHFAGRKLSPTGNEPAITRGQLRVRLDPEWVLYDTPGMMAPRLDDQEAAYLLAMLGSIRQTAVDSEDVAWHAAELLLARFPDRLSARYGEIPLNTGAEGVLQAVAASQGALARGGRPDWARSAGLLLNDLRSGKLGRLSLESPPALHS